MVGKSEEGKGRERSCSSALSGENLGDFFSALVCSVDCFPGRDIGFAGKLASQTNVIILDPDSMRLLYTSSFDEKNFEIS